MKETVDITPHWPGMLRWLEHIATDLGNAEDDHAGKPDAVAITGGADTDMFAIWSGEAFKFVEGGFHRAKVYNPSGVGHPATAEDVLDIAYCTKVGEVITVNGEVTR